MRFNREICYRPPRPRGMPWTARVKKELGQNQRLTIRRARSLQLHALPGSTDYPIHSATFSSSRSELKVGGALVGPARNQVVAQCEVMRPGSAVCPRESGTARESGAGCYAVAESESRLPRRRGLVVFWLAPHVYSTGNSRRGSIRRLDSFARRAPGDIRRIVWHRYVIVGAWCGMFGSGELVS